MIEILKIAIVIFSLAGAVLASFGIPAISEKMLKTKGSKDFVKFLFGKGRNINIIMLFLNIGISALIGLIIIFHLMSEKFILIGLFMIPLTMALLLTWFSYAYMNYDVDIFVNLNDNDKNSQGLKKWLEENSGAGMCTAYIVLYVFIVVFVFANKYIYNAIPNIQKVKIETETPEEALLDPKINSFKLTLLYYYLGLILASFIIMTTVFFGDQSSDAYQYYFCNTYVKSGKGYGSNGGSSSGGGGGSYGSGGGSSSGGGGGSYSSSGGSSSGGGGGSY